MTKDKLTTFIAKYTVIALIILPLALIAGVVGGIEMGTISLGGF